MCFIIINCNELFQIDTCDSLQTGMEVPRVSSTVVLVPPSSSATGMLAADSAAQVARQCVSIRSTVATSLDCHCVLCHVVIYFR